jgi:hypothetical protein
MPVILIVDCGGVRGTRHFAWQHGGCCTSYLLHPFWKRTRPGGATTWVPLVDDLLTLPFAALDENADENTSPVLRLFKLLQSTSYTVWQVLKDSGVKWNIDADVMDKKVRWRSTLTVGMHASRDAPIVALLCVMMHSSVDPLTPLMTAWRRRRLVWCAGHSAGPLEHSQMWIMSMLQDVRVSNHDSGELQHSIGGRVAARLHLCRGEPQV